MSEFHDQFARALKTGDSAALAAFTEGSPETKFKVYRNNVVKGAADTLGDAYPVIKRLVGEEFFHGMARAYWAKHPPASRTLTLFGEHFSDFIDQFEPAAQLIYLPDVARMERAWLEAHHAPDAKPLALADVKSLPPQKLAAIAPGLHPSVHLIASELPAFSIWKTNREDLQVKKVSLESGAETALFHRPQMEVRYRRLSPAEILFLTRIKAGQTFETASSAVSDHFPGADPVPVFIALLKEGVFNGLE
ncbi:DNA-binding domain-containing protein [Hyphobacterium sp.]|uniref:HvfC/BufC N-terminal domain-containing protein n=1 Tax=Hyphobacterium sp. TaxID=2004662 RepID=UPI003BAB379E